MSVASAADATHTATETVAGGGPTTVTHDQTIANGELRLVAELGVTDWLAAGLIVPVRTYHTSIRYLDAAGDPVMIDNATLHHRNETLTGPGDPWLTARAARDVRGFVLGGRLGLTLPLGRTVEDPFALGDMGIAHEHSQFGTGSVGAIAGGDLSRVVRGVHLDGSLLTIQTFYANGHGYTAGDRYAVALGAASALGTRHWRFRATAETVWETAERWNGVVHTDDGNVGRTDVLAGAEATWLVNDDWHVALSVKVPAYTHIEGGQLDALGFVGLSVGTHLHVFEDKHAAGAHTHTHEIAPAPQIAPVPGKITVVDYWATWCEPCTVVDRELSALSRRHSDDLVIHKVDASEDTGGRTLPYLTIYGRDGARLFEGNAPPLALVAEVDRALGGPPSRPKPAVRPAARRIAITVTDAGFEPGRVTVPRGEPVTLVFTRRSSKTCATDVHMTLPDGTRIDEQLPLDKPVSIPLQVARAGDIVYACGMDMVRGTITVK